MASFPVRIDLRKYFSDERSRCFVMITCQEGRRINWLQERLRSLFPQHLQDTLFCLMKQDHLLPADESILLLQPNDEVVVTPLKDNWNFKAPNALIGQVRSSRPLRKNEVNSVNGVKDICNNSFDSTMSEYDAAISDVVPEGHGEAEELRRRKRCALELADAALSATEPTPHEMEPPGPEPRARRRRVRRRRAPEPLAHTLQLLWDQPAQDDSVGSMSDAGGDGTIIRNAGVQSAAPRRVTAMNK